MSRVKNYLVVGGSSGIGLSLCRLLSDQGQQLDATYCKTPMEQALPGIRYHRLNVLEELPTLDFLPDRLDGFAYCPGSINLQPFARIRPQEFEQDYQLQVVGAIKVLQAILPRLKAAEQASVVFFSTVAVQTGFSFHSQVAASKGALEGLTRSLAAELAPGIRVNAVAPSITQTPLAARFLSSEDKIKANAQRHPLKKIGAPEDVAQLAAFLLSDKASWITGQILAVDGGISALRI